MDQQNAPTIECARQVSDLLSQLAAEMMRTSAGSFLRLLQREGLSMPRAVALMYLERECGASISDISNYLNLSLATTSHLVDQLVCGGYVTRTEDQADRRMKSIALTPQGRTFMHEVKQVRIAEMAQRLEELPGTLLESAVAALAALREQLQPNAGQL